MSGRRSGRGAETAGPRIRVPLHLSGFWCPNYGRSPATTGSVGAGVTLGPPLAAALLESAVYTLNGRPVPREGVDAISRLVPGAAVFGIRASAPAGLGEGLGVSAALLIALSASALASRRSRVDDALLRRACVLAHEVEVTGRTGLGDVIAESVGGGLVVRVRPGPPGVGEAYPVRVRDSFEVAVVRLGSMITPNMLKRYAGRIAVCGRVALSRFLRNPTLEEFLRQSLWFGVRTGMLSGPVNSAVRELLSPMVRRGCVLGYFMKKSLLAVFTSRGCGEEVARVLMNACSSGKLNCVGRVKVLGPDTKKAMVLNA